jgi:hypothetical protein
MGAAGDDPMSRRLLRLTCAHWTGDGCRALPGIPPRIRLQTRRYDLLKVTKLCTAVDKAGTPAILSGPNKGAAKPITPFTRPGDTQLLCYQARLAKKHMRSRAVVPRTRRTRAR